MEGKNHVVDNESLQSGARYLFSGLLISQVLDFGYRLTQGGSQLITIMILGAIAISLIVMLGSVFKLIPSFSDLIEGLRIKDERVIYLVDRSAMFGIITNFIFIFGLVVGVSLANSVEAIAFELGMIIIIAAVFGFKAMRGGAVTSTYKGLEEPYYEDQNKESALKNRMIITGIGMFIFWVGIDLVYYDKIIVSLDMAPLFGFITVLLIEMVTSLTLIFIELKFMHGRNQKYLNEISE